MVPILSYGENPTGYLSADCVGAVEVYYGEERQDSDEGSFLKERRSLIVRMVEDFWLAIVKLPTVSENGA